MSSKGNRTIGIVNGPEKYETIETSFSEIINDINSVNNNGKIKVNDKEIAIELFLGGDYKFLLMAMGICLVLPQIMHASGVRYLA